MRTVTIMRTVTVVRTLEVTRAGTGNERRTNDSAAQCAMRPRGCGLCDRRGPRLTVGTWARVLERSSGVVIGGMGFVGPPEAGSVDIGPGIDRHAKAAGTPPAVIALASTAGVVTGVVVGADRDDPACRTDRGEVPSRPRPWSDPALEVSGPFPHRVTSGGGRRVSAAMRKGNRRSAGHVSLWYDGTRRPDGTRSASRLRATWGWRKREVLELPQCRHFRYPLQPGCYVSATLGASAARV
jgi:hypothetical protein